MNHWRAFLLTLLLFISGALQAASFDIQPQLSSQKLTGEWDYCQQSGVIDLASISQCQFSPTPQHKLHSGFSPQTHWLRFELTNPTSQQLNRLLEVGHPRLQYIRLVKQDKLGGLHAFETGQNIPLNQRPVIAQRLLVPIQLAAHETATFYVAVSSETRIDLSLRLWEFNSYFAQESRNQVIQALAMGGLLLAVIFSFIIFVQWREWATLWLALSFSAEILLDASYTGLLSAYFWPADVAFDIHLHAFFAAATITFFLGFVRVFLATRVAYPKVDWLILLLMSLMLIVGLSAFWVGYGTPIKLIALLALTSMLLSSGLFYLAWRDGSGPAGYLLVGYLLLVGMICYRTFMALGWLPALPLEAMGFSWYFLLIAPTALIAVTKRYDAIKQDLIRTESEREAYAYFLTSMSHELRSPVGRILTQAKSLDVQSSQQLQQQNVGSIRQASQDLLAMIDDILDYARTRAGKVQLHIEPFSLTAFMASVVEEVMPQTEAAANRLVWRLNGVGTNDWVRADERRLRQVTVNLLSNANRYCHHGVVRFEIEVMDEDESHCQVRLSVTDTGVGIEAEDMALIFKPFERIGALRSKVDGVGIGLSVCQELVGLMGGRIDVTSEPNKGSEFIVTLRLEKEVAARQLPMIDLAQLSRPAEEALARLKNYAELGSITDIEHWLAQMQQQAPEHAVFYAQVQTALQTLNLPLLKWLSS